MHCYAAYTGGGVSKTKPLPKCTLGEVKSLNEQTILRHFGCILTVNKHSR